MRSCRRDIARNQLLSMMVKEAELKKVHRSDEMAKIQGGHHFKTVTSGKYGKKDTEEIAKDCKHLKSEQQDELAFMLANFELLFDEKLKAYNGPKVKLKLDPDVKPFRFKTFQIPQTQRQVFKKELDRCIEEGVLARTGPFE